MDARSKVWWGTLAAVAALWSCGGDSAAPPGPALLATTIDSVDTGPRHARKDIYGIVNLAPPVVFGGRINDHGQALFEYTALDNRLHVGFFDGARVIDVNPPNADVTTIGALNDRGMVAAQTRVAVDQVPAPFAPLRWTAGSGRTMLARLNPEGDSFTTDINNRGEIVGSARTGPGDAPFRAVRWTAQNRLMLLQAPAGYSHTFAGVINEHDVTAGSGNDAAGNTTVLLWDAAGRVSILGALGARSAAPVDINDRGEIVGLLNQPDPDFQSFLYTPGKPTLRIGAATVATAFNQAGEVAGRIVRENEENHAFYFSRKRGLVDLHPRQYGVSEAGDINDSGVLVGLVRASATAEGRAFRWTGASASAGVDLNTRLRDAPAGLLLTSALAIADNGDILCNSNAGMIMLRLGGGGTDAPVVGPIQTSAAQPNAQLRLTLSFSDRNARETHTATVDWGDGSGLQAARVKESGGKGEASAVHTYAAQGSYTVVVRVTDSAGKTTYTRQLVGVSQLHAGNHSTAFDAHH